MAVLGSRKRERLIESLCPDAYVTDGIRLYRVVCALLDPWNGHEAAQLEDCLTLETGLYSSKELSWMRLNLVRAPA